MDDQAHPYRPLDLDAFTMVDFKRLAFPQADGYDSEVFEEIALWRYGWKPISPHPDSGIPAWMDGQVEIRPVKRYQPWLDRGWVDVPPGDPRWEQAGKLAETWPTQADQFKRLINYMGWAAPTDTPSGGSGSSTTSVGGNPFNKAELISAERWGCMYVGSSGNTGLLEGVAHELAHWKGYCLGIYIEEWEHLIFQNQVPLREHIENAPGREELSDAERRRLWNPLGIGLQPFNERCRPIGAMFQEIWAMIHMIAFHLAIWDKVEPQTHGREQFIHWARFHVARSKRGHEDLLNMADLVPGPGEQFWEGYCSWTDGLIREGEKAWGIETPTG